jgi:hypothetical protein
MGPHKRDALGGVPGSPPIKHEETHLPRVIGIVDRRALNRPTHGPPRSRKRPRQVFGSKLAHHAHKQPVLLLEQPQISAPSALGERIPPEEVAAFEREGQAAVMRDSSPNDVLPVGRVDREFRDVVPTTGRAPCRIARGHAPKGTSQ